MRDMIESFNVKWIAYMTRVVSEKGLENVTECPNGHKLLAYIPKNYGHVVITCPHGGIGTGVDICDYFDYHTYKVPIGTELAMEVEEH